MTADRLDEQAEARIREACPYHDGWTRYREQCWWCDRLRAAILADREARETKLRCEVVMCSGCEAILDVTPMYATVDGDVGAFITQTEPGKMPAERAHADALAECLRDCEDRAELGYAVRNRRLTLLAAHDKRRGK